MNIFSFKRSECWFELKAGLITALCWTIKNDAKELMLSNCGAGHDSWESLWWKEIKSINTKGNQPFQVMEGLMLKLKLQYFNHQMWKANSLEKIWCWERLKAKGERSSRGWGGQTASLTQWTWIRATLGDTEAQCSLGCCSPWGHRVWTRLSEWTTTKKCLKPVDTKFCRRTLQYYITERSDILIFNLFYKEKNNEPLTSETEHFGPMT